MSDDQQQLEGVPKVKWTKQDYILATTAILIKLGDGVELYLPGVITQKVSCELGISKFQEGILAIIVYIFYGLAVVISVPVIKYLGEKVVLFLSLYLSVLFAILCALVPNYYTMLLSRALIGICAGLNGCTIGLYLAKYMSCKDVHDESTFLFEGFAVPVGGAWISILGWLILDPLGWRMFVLTTSIPLFIPPIIILHILVKTASTNASTESCDDIDISGNSEEDIGHERSELISRDSDFEVPNFYLRVTKSSLLFFCNIALGYGSIILLPWLMRDKKRDEMENTEDLNNGCSKSIVHGKDLLILSAVTGAANVIGRPIGFFLWRRIRFLPLQLTVTTIMALCYATILFLEDITTTEILIAVSKFCYSLQAVEIAILHFDYGYFGLSRLDLGSSISVLFGMCGAIFGTSLAAFLTPDNAVRVSLGTACVAILVVCLMKERF